MRQRHWWAIGAATGTGLLGLSVTGGLALLALHFVEEFSRPHETFDSEEFQWQMPKVTVEPPRSRKHLLTFTSSDGTLLRGEFWAQSCPAPTIVICHGYRVSGTFLSPVAAQEYASGYNVLMFDFRGHGDSESVATSGGIAEIRDLEAALAVVRQQPQGLPCTIIPHGFFLGAATALLALPHSDNVAIISGSAHVHLG